MQGGCRLQYNTCFWALVKSGVSRLEAQAALKVCSVPPVGKDGFCSSRPA